MDTQEFIQKVFCDCQHKREIINPYTGGLVLVPCGVCDACRVSKAIVSENRLYAQRVTSKYCFFVTLTYKNEYVPYYTYEAVDIDSERVAVSAHVRPRPRMYRTIVHHGVKRHCLVKGLSMNEEFDFDFFCKKDYWQKYSAQADLSMNGKYPQYSGRIGYLCHADLSLFMKRVRKQILLRDIPYEKLHTYIVGEYGPKSFRPHFHILFFFNGDKLAQNFIRIARSCWRFGRFDCSASRGYVESYVSSYLNSFTSLPLHIKENRSIRPFARFSNGFGLEFFQDSIQKTKSGEFTDFLDGKSVSINGRYRTVRPWSSVINTCFFRPLSYNSVSVSQCATLLRYVRNIRQRPAYWKASLYELPELIYNHYYSHCHQTETRIELLYDAPMLCVMNFLNIDESRGSLGDDEFKRSFCSRFYIFFRHCEMFLRGIGYSLSSVEVDSNRLYAALKNSKSFYNEREKQSLNRLFEASQAFESDWADIFWNQTQERQKQFSESGLGSMCRDKLSRLVHDRVKHRELNDMNNFFTDRANYV